MALNLFSPKKFVGIDIGNEYIKIAVVEKNNRGLSLSSLEEFKTPFNLINNNFNDLNEEFSKEVSTVINKLNIKKSSQVIASIGGKNVLVRNLRLPVMPDKELKQAIQWELTKYINIDPENMVVDYIILSKNKEQIEIMVFASKNELLIQMYNFLKQYGIAPHKIDLEVMGLSYLRAFAEKNDKLSFEQGNWMVVDLGHTKTTVAIFENYMLNFVHTINSNISAMNNDYSYLIYDELAREIQRIIDYFQLQLKKGEIKNIYVIGGSASEQVVQKLQERINLKINLFPIYSIFEQINLPENLEQIPNQFITAIGMAVREVV